MFASKFAELGSADAAAQKKYPECIDSSFVNSKILHEDNKCIAFKIKDDPSVKFDFIVAPKSSTFENASP